MQEQIEDIRHDRLGGMTYRAIAEKYGIDQRTAKRYAEGNLPLSELERRPFPSILDPYDPLIRAALQEKPVSAKAIYRLLREQGYQGGYTIVVRRVRRVIDENTFSGRYPPDLPRTGKLPDKETLQKRIMEEKNYAASRARKR